MAACRPPNSIEDLHRALKDRPLDPGQILAADPVRRARRGGGSRAQLAQHASGSLELPRSARDRDDLDGPALVFERVPEPAVRRSPGAECGRGVVAGIDVDEHGAARVQRDGQFEREAGISLRKSL